MKIQTQAHGNVSVLAAHGPLISEELVDLRRAIEAVLAIPARRAVVDMSDVPYVDSAGIELLAALCHVNRSAHQRPRLAALSETCLEALELTDTLPQLEVYDTVENAIRSCQR